MANFIPVRGSSKTNFTSTLSPQFPLWDVAQDYNSASVVMHDVSDDANRLIEHRLYSAAEQIVAASVSHYTISFVDNNFNNTIFSSPVTIGGIDITITSGDTEETIAKVFAEEYTKSQATIRAKYIGSGIVDVADTSISITPISSPTIQGLNITVSSASTFNESPDKNALWNNIDDDPEFSGTGIGAAFVGSQNIKGYYTVVSDNAAVDGCLVPIYRPNANNTLSIRWSNGRTTASIFETLGDVTSTLSASVTKSGDFNPPLLTAPITVNSFQTTLPVTLANGTSTTTTSNTITRYTPYYFGFDINNLNESNTNWSNGTSINTGAGTIGNFYIAIISTLPVITEASVNGFDLTIASPLTTTLNATTYNLYTITGTRPNIILGNIE